MNYEKLLNEQVANLIIFYVKLHNYHWYVKGHKFYRLHELFEDLYDEATENYDVVAERMLMLQMKPVGTLKESLSLSTIKEANNNETPLQMVQNILADFIHLNNRFKLTLTEAEDKDDDVTADILTGMRITFQKHIWMLREFLNEES